MRTRHPILHTSVVAAGLLFAGCEDHPQHDLGNTVQATSSETPEPDLGLPVAQHVNELAGEWLGEAEDPFALASSAELNPPPYRLPSGSTHIWLRITPGEDAEATLTFGDVDPPAPATDPDLPYPAGAPATALVFDASPRPPVEGFPYLMSRVYTERDAAAGGVTEPESLEDLFNGALLDGKLDLSYTPTEVFGSWCALQTADSCKTGGYSVDEEGLCYALDDTEPADCGKAALCASEVCLCEPGYPCSYNFNLSATLVLRLTEEGLVGLFQNGVFMNERGFQQPLATVHFRRVGANDAP